MNINGNKVIGIIQARMGSTRFPGKMSADLGGYPIIDWVIRRSKQSKLIHKLVLATSTKTENDYLVEVSNKHMIESYRGSENNVLSRFLDIALKENADIVVRICADNPFIDPGEIDRLIKFYINTDCEYACNHQDRLDSGYADGFGAEIFSSDVLSKINSLAKKKDHREHVTKYIWDNKNDFKIAVVPSPKELHFPSYKFDVDTMEDKNCLENLIANGISIDSSAKKIVALYRDLTNHKYA